ncbi:hypothetical protein [Moritella sp. F3]|uniref:hypothetical protein n=1 Tax=Moritella sp. F3 TaxID=2718882 RepID=UPI0018E10892|nr:hypothetical protein [Moritella sp. F3]GIC77124.1 hypothetical protein FMO001_18510 [Moritella sp. F1]GIC82243.1 hypothetical protein FMO003_25240 [Moritella sp. F3]
MNKYLRKTIAWGGVSAFGLSMFVVGQINQVITINESVTAHFISEWVALDRDNEKTLQRYKLICRKPISDSKSFIDSIENPPVSHDECAVEANAIELYAVIQKANNIIDLNWPLSEL